MRVDIWLVVLLAFGLASLANGAWMLVDSQGWFERVAADVVPFNVHFVRDVGAAYFTAGVALLWAAFHAEWRAPLVATAALFNALHALGHVRETLSGELASLHWWLDLPGVYLPSLILAALAVLFLRRARSRAS